MRRLISYLPLLLTCSVVASAVASAAIPTDCWSLRNHGHRTEAQACFEALTRSADAYTRAEGYWGLEEWDQANEQFRLATQPANSKALYKVRWGMLLHERFNNPEAAALFHEALSKDPSNAEAYLGLAIVSADGFDSKATEYTAKAIALDPKLARAHELMANLALENDESDLAVEEADKALALDKDALDAMAIRAASAETVFAAASKAPTRALPSGASNASPCPTAQLLMVNGLI